MKHILTSLVFLFILINNILSQTLIAQWTFPTGTGSDSLADGGTAANLGIFAINTQGGTSAIDFSKNGYTTKAAQATGWDNGNGAKCWQIEISTTGYDSLTISSRQQSGGTYPGPGNFKLQYLVGIPGTWTDIPNGTIVTANDWTTAYVNNLNIPSACYNQPSVFIRWIMTSNLSSTGVTLTSAGISKIDEIYIYGKPSSSNIQSQEMSSGVQIYPIPAKDYLKIFSFSGISELTIYNITGSILLNMRPDSNEIMLNTENLNTGIYIIGIKPQKSELPYFRKIIISR